MSLTEFLDRLSRALSLLEVAEDQMVEAVSELQLCGLDAESQEVRVLRKTLSRTLTSLRSQVRENIEVDSLIENTSRMVRAVDRKVPDVPKRKDL